MADRPLWTCPRQPLTSPSEVDDAFAALVVEAYAVARQEHLRRS
jgi:hypothetical protein